MDWIDDGHKIQAVLDGDQVRPEVICPRHTDRDAQVSCGFVENYSCSFGEEVKEIGWELNQSGWAILIGGPIPIEYRWDVYGEVWFKCVGYPDDAWVTDRRKEIGEAFDCSWMSVPERLTSLLFSSDGWENADQEIKDEILSEMQRAKENNG